MSSKGRQKTSAEETGSLAAIEQDLAGQSMKELLESMRKETAEAKQEMEKRSERMEKWLEELSKKMDTVQGTNGKMENQAATGSK